VLCRYPQQPPAQAENKTPPENAPRSLSARQILKAIQTGQGPVPERWETLFAEAVISDSQLASAIQLLHEEQKYGEAIECLEAALRSGRAAPWLYDLLALEMKLAGRSADEIGRVLQSRLDFGVNDVPQMLLTAALLSRFEAWDAALTLLRDAAQLNPDTPELWLLARSVADKSGRQDSRVWSRCGILRYVWTDNYERQHDEAVKVLREMAEALDRAGKSPDAEALRNQLQVAQQVDLQIQVKWVGNADLDLIVVDPNGEECSFRRRRTSTLGRLVREDGGIQQGGGKGSETRLEQFVQPVAVPGKYEFSVRFVVGKVGSGTAVVEVIHNARTPEETRETKTIQLGQEDVRLSTTVPTKPQQSGDGNSP
jgi:hypothetical protein